MINYAAEHGLQRLTGITMPNNQGMITLARKLGFDVDIQIQDGIVNLSLVLKKNRITLQKTVSLSHEQAKDAHIGED
jgi:acetyltransferase